MKKLFYLNFTLFLLFNNLLAQEASINDWNVLYINAWDNPALTGISNRQFRVQGDFDRQKAKNANWADKRINTMLDASIRIRKDYIGIGLNYGQDAKGISKFGEHSLGADLAYHKSIGKKAIHYISIGGDFTYRQIGFGLNPSTSLFFDSQYEPSFPNQYNPDPSFSNEVFSAANRNLFDISTGLWYQSKYGFLGISIKHITAPTIQYLSGTASPEDAILYRKLNITGGYNFYLKKYTITPSFNINKQTGGFTWQANILTAYKSNYVFGTSIKNANRMSFILGTYLFKHIRLNTGYTIPLKSDLKYFGNIFEAGLRFEFGKFKNEKK